MCAFFAILSGTLAAPASTPTLEKRRRGGGGRGGGGGIGGGGGGAANFENWKVVLIITGTIAGTGLILCLVYRYRFWFRQGAKKLETLKTPKVSETPKLSWRVKTGFEDVAKPEQVWVLRRSTLRQ